MNILTTENLAKHNTKNAASGVGEWHQRNGVWAMDIRPVPFYRNYVDTDGTTYISYCLRDEITPGQWIFNLWIDADDVIYNNANRAAGLCVVYADGSSVNLVVTGGSGVGFQHKYYISDANKTIDRISVYYYASLPTYYRSDSFIVPVSETSFGKNGVINSGFYIEDLGSLNNSVSDNLGMSIGKYGINAQEFIEC